MAGAALDPCMAITRLPITGRETARKVEQYHRPIGLQFSQRLARPRRNPPRPRLPETKAGRFIRVGLSTIRSTTLVPSSVSLERLVQFLPCRAALVDGLVDAHRRDDHRNSVRAHSVRAHVMVGMGDTLRIQPFQSLLAGVAVLQRDDFSISAVIPAASALRSGFSSTSRNRRRNCFGGQFHRFFGDEFQGQAGGLRQNLLPGGPFQIVEIVKSLRYDWDRSRQHRDWPETS